MSATRKSTRFQLSNSLKQNSYLSMNTKRGKPLAICNGHLMTQEKKSADGLRQYWRCQMRGQGCRGRAVSRAGSGDLRETVAHDIHGSSPAEIKKRKVLNDVKQMPVEKRRATSLASTIETANCREKAIQKRNAFKVPAKRPSQKMCQVVVSPPKRGRGRPLKDQANTYKHQAENLRGWGKRAAFVDARDMMLVLNHHMMQETEIYSNDQLPVVNGSNLKLYTCIMADSKKCRFEMFSVQRQNEVTKYELYRSTRSGKYWHNHASIDEAPVNPSQERNNEGYPARVEVRISNAPRVPKTKLRKILDGTHPVIQADESDSETNEPGPLNAHNPNRYGDEISESSHSNIPATVAPSTTFDISSDAIADQMLALAEDLRLQYTGLDAYHSFCMRESDERTFFITNDVIDHNTNPVDVLACERHYDVTTDELRWRKVDSTQFLWALRGKLIEFFYPLKLSHRHNTKEGCAPQRQRVEFEDDDENDCGNGRFRLDRNKVYDFEEFAYKHDFAFGAGTRSGRLGFCFSSEDRQIVFYDLQNSVKIGVRIGSEATTEIWNKGDWSQFYYAVRGRSIKLIYGSPKERQKNVQLENS